jgi:hypothetical protein
MIVKVSMLQNAAHVKRGLTLRHLRLLVFLHKPRLLVWSHLSFTNMDFWNFWNWLITFLFILHYVGVRRQGQGALEKRPSTSNF